MEVEGKGWEDLGKREGMLKSAEAETETTARRVEIRAFGVMNDRERAGGRNGKTARALRQVLIILLLVYSTFCVSSTPTLMVRGRSCTP